MNNMGSASSGSNDLSASLSSLKQEGGPSGHKRAREYEDTAGALESLADAQIVVVRFFVTPTRRGGPFEVSVRTVGNALGAAICAISPPLAAGLTGVMCHFGMELEVHTPEGQRYLVLERGGDGMTFHVGRYRRTFDAVNCYEWRFPERPLDYDATLLFQRRVVRDHAHLLRTVYVRDAIEFCRRESAREYNLLSNNCKHTCYRMLTGVLGASTFTSFESFRDNLQWTWQRYFLTVLQQPSHERANETRTHLDTQ